jgi:hypothetical protein
MRVGLCLVFLLLLTGCAAESGGMDHIKTPGDDYPPVTENKKAPDAGETYPAPKLSVRNITSAQFVSAVENPRHYDVPGHIRAGVVPHHTTAASMISGFFSLAAQNAEGYDTVVIVGPNHKGDLADIILADRDWDIGEGVKHDAVFTQRLAAAASDGFNIIINNERVEDDHSASIIVPYVYHYLPHTRVVTVLITRSLGFDAELDFARLVVSLAEELGRNMLVVCSIDFSHFLSPREAMARTRVVEEAIVNRDYKKIHRLCDNYLDSPGTMNIFLHILSAYGLQPLIIDRTEASELMRFALDETTSYLVILGADEE